MRLQTKVTIPLSQAGEMVLDSLTEEDMRNAKVTVEDGKVITTIERTIDEFEQLVVDAAEITTQQGDTLVTQYQLGVGLVTTVTRKDA